MRISHLDSLAVRSPNLGQVAELRARLEQMETEKVPQTAHLGGKGSRQASNPEEIKKSEKSNQTFQNDSLQEAVFLEKRWPSAIDLH